MPEYSFWPYEHSNELEVSISDFRIDGEESEGRVNHDKKRIDVAEDDWQELSFDILLGHSELEHLFPDDMNARAVVTIDSRETGYREGIGLEPGELKRKVKMRREDVKGSVRVNAYICRNTGDDTPTSGYASHAGQRIAVIGEDDRHWKVLADKTVRKVGSFLEVKIVSFKKEGMEPEEVDYSLQLEVAGKPVLYVNKDNETFVRIWNNNGKPHTDRKLRALQELMDNDMVSEVYTQILLHGIYTAVLNEEWENGDSPGYREQLLKDWKKKHWPELTKKEFLDEIHNNPEKITLIASEIDRMVEKPRRTKRNLEILS